MTDDLEKKLADEEATVPTSRVGRLWRMGRTAARVGTRLAEALDALAVIGATPPTDAQERQILRELLRAFFSPLLATGRRRMELTSLSGARSVLSDKRRLMKLRLPPEMLFLFRLRFGLFSVLHRMGAEVDWAALEAGWASECALAAGSAPAAT